MRHSESISAIAKALADFQAEVEDPKMDEKKEYYTKTNRKILLKYASLKAILKTARPVLAKHGIAIIQEPKTEGNRVTITTVLLHSSGEWIEFEPFSMNAQSPIAQEIGSATTYAKRYSIAAILGLGAEDDDDGNGASEGIDEDGKAEKPAEKKAAQVPKPAAQTPPPTPQAKAQEPKANGSGKISARQQQELFHAANGNADLVKQVIMNHAYVKTAEIELYDFDGILKEIIESAAKQSA